ncbi:integration host factor, actinobacterial type [Streptomyces sp. NPDC019539]|uniref:integration host factor, actinobacterial type n=1 Tax=Streptomyces sp. NPDC019539 TaxID=3365063 RepID=UPI0037A8B01A
MALPPLTAEQLAQNSAKAVANRQERATLLAGLKNGSLALEDVLGRNDQAVARIPVRRLLASLPGIGPVKAEQHLSELGISPSRRVQGLGPRQKDALLARFSSRT